MKLTQRYGRNNEGMFWVATVDAEADKVLCYRITLPKHKGYRGRYLLRDVTDPTYHRVALYYFMKGVHEGEQAIIAAYESSNGVPWEEPEPHSVQGVMSGGLPTLGKKHR